MKLFDDLNQFITITTTIHTISEKHLFVTYKYCRSGVVDI